MADPAAHDPSLTSYYVGNAFYQTLVDAFSGWQDEDGEVSDPVLRDTCRRLLEREARYLDQIRLDEWLALFARECVYWVPATPHGGDPRREIAVAFDDRRRMEDRVFRLKNDYAWSQRPQSRTVRFVTNVTVFKGPDAASLMVRSNFLTSEFQAGDKRVYTGWSGHWLREREGNWEIVAKQVNLIDCDQNLRNPSIVI